MNKNVSDFRNLEKRLCILEKEVMHLKKALQYQSQKKNRKFN